MIPRNEVHRAQSKMKPWEAEMKLDDMSQILLPDMVIVYGAVTETTTTTLFQPVHCN